MIVAHRNAAPYRFVILRLPEPGAAKQRNGGGRRRISSFPGWNPMAAAEGDEGEILVVTFDVKMEQSMIDALHHGRLSYERVLAGGVAAFADNHGFKKVLYRDGYGLTWEYP